MYLSIVNVKPLENYRLLLIFENKEQRIFDATPYLDQGKYLELKNVALFNSVRISFDSIQWPNELDFDPEFLYENGVPA